MANKINIDGGAAAARQPETIKDGIPRDAPRWLFFAGDFPNSKREAYPAGGVDFGSPCIVPPMGKPGYMNRCLITPCIEMMIPMNKREVPSGAKVLEVIPGRDVLGRTTDTVHTSLYPGEEWEALQRAYKAWGIREIVSLRGRQPADVATFKFNSLFFPDWPTLPETNAELITYIQDRATFFHKSVNRDLYQKIADEMIAGVQAVDTWYRTHIDAVHSCFLLPDDHEAHRTNYDQVDLHFIKRAGLQRRDKDLSTMADTQAAIAKILTQPPQPAANGVSQEQFLESLKLLLAQNAEVIKASMAQTAAPVPPPEKT